MELAGVLDLLLSQLPRKHLKLYVLNFVVVAVCDRNSYLLLVFMQLAEMNGKMVVSKPLYVALAQRKEERRARLQVC